ncbi:hypothetical protein [Chromobacterium amazonense]|uniref:Uncharacterized protein n=1 Tax=Chromobacterium amazonense TaxID=1382803 RepID=A0ABU8V6X8_9NEIS|nr:hypothetical protein [Chromobacterium amazonense]MDQ4539519.1 hypothetical protein [Chromobacterium amazonense]
MDFRDINIEKIVARICNSDTTGEAFQLYQLAAPLLIDYKFVFASDKGGQPGFAVNRTFSAGAAVRSLFKTDRIIVLDPDTTLEMESGQSTYPIDYSISLDTNAMSYLVPHMAGKRGGGIPADFLEVFEFIASPEVNVDPIPYFTENLPNLADGKSADEIFENLKAYEILRTIDADWLKSKGQVQSTLTEQELAKSAQQLLSKMYMDISDDTTMKGIKFRHQYMYACLIKMAAIQLKSPSVGIGKKMSAFMEFCHSGLATMSVREAAVARAYFTQGQDLTFFGKIQKKSKKDILELLRNMAWDMWHVRQMEQSITLNPTKQARYFFPALLTFDRRFIEIMDLYPLKACAFKVGESQPMPFFDGDAFRLIATDDEDGASAVKKYFSEDAIATREAARDRVRANFSVVIDSLEKELLAIAK